MAENIIKMKCPDDDCQENREKFEAEIKEVLFTGGEHRSGIKGDVGWIKAKLNTKLSRSTSITAGISILSIGVVVLLYMLSSWAAYKEIVLINKSQVGYNKEQIEIHKDRFEKIDEKLERIQSQQVRIKDDILQAIRGLKK